MGKSYDTTSLTSTIGSAGAITGGCLVTTIATGGHHRHYMGSVEPVELDNYEAIVKRFEDELAEIRRKEDEEARR